MGVVEPKMLNRPELQRVKKKIEALMTLSKLNGQNSLEKEGPSVEHGYDSMPRPFHCRDLRPEALPPLMSRNSFRRRSICIASVKNEPAASSMSSDDAESAVPRHTIRRHSDALDRFSMKEIEESAKSPRLALPSIKATSPK